MDIVERFARALCRADHCDPDRKLAVFRGNPSTAWELYTEDAKAAIRAVLEGVEPFAYRYFIKPPEAGMGKTIFRTWPDPHLVDDGWTETPLYSLEALKEALK